MNQEGELIMAEYDKLLSEKTKIVATIHISNALINPVKYMIDQAHTYGAAVLIDGAQAVPFKTNMQELDCDFYVFQDIKYVANRGFYTEESWLNKLPAYQGGGEMIKDVSLRKLLMLDCLINLKPERRMLLVESFRNCRRLYERSWL
jgi:cysteine desulfurase/selenocysteine lyase